MVRLGAARGGKPWRQCGVVRCHDSPWHSTVDRHNCVLVAESHLVIASRNTGEMSLASRGLVQTGQPLLCHARYPCSAGTSRSSTCTSIVL